MGKIVAINVVPSGMELQEVQLASHVALGFAFAAHAGQLYNEVPYITHCLAVALPFVNTPRYVPAVLHDTVEDNSKITVADLRWVFGSWTASVVDALSRRENEIYLSEYLPRLAENQHAVAIKVSDLSVNIGYCMKDPVKWASKLKRYQAALAYLGTKAV